MAKKSKTSPKIGLKNVRLSFPNLWTPKQFEVTQDARFEATFLLDPTNAENKATIDKIKAEAKALALAAFDGQIPGDLKFCLTNNQNEDGTQKKAYDGYAGMYVLATAKPAEMEDIPEGQPGYGINPARGRRQGLPLQRPKKGFSPVDGKPYFIGQPGIVNRAVVPVREGDPGAPYAGCYVNATITLWSQDNQWGKRINANLVNVQFLRDGEAFGRGQSAPEEDFDPIETPEGEAPVSGAAKADDGLFG